MTTSSAFRWQALALAIVLAGCDSRDEAAPPATSTGAAAEATAPGTADPADAATAEVADPADAAQAVAAPEERGLPVLEEAFLSAMTPEDNIDAPAAWRAPDGGSWLVATAKSTHRLVVYDGLTGQTLRHVGTRGTGEGEFERPNGIAVIDDLLFVVERDNHRVQVLGLPDFEHVITFGAEDLIKPYSLWVDGGQGRYTLYVTDSYEGQAGEVPPLRELDRRVKHYALQVHADGSAQAELLGAFGDTGEIGALRVVESIWGDPANGRLLIAEEDESYANELKVYTLDGRFEGRTLGGDVFQAQAEGITLRTCGEDGWWLTTEQAADRTTFHLFDRVALDYVGGFAGTRVANTDGIWYDGASERFPQGVLYAVHDDQGVVAFDWREIAEALALPDCPAQQGERP